MRFSQKAQYQALGQSLRLSCGVCSHTACPAQPLEVELRLRSRVASGLLPLPVGKKGGTPGGVPGMTKTRHSGVAKVVQVAAMEALVTATGAMPPLRRKI